MTNHPLTDTDCKQIQEDTHHIPYGSWYYGEDPSLLDDLVRAGYDKGAADMLEQVIQFLEANKDFTVDTVLRFIRPMMRLQEES